MTRYTYPAIITYYPDKGSYVADFPDFPGAMLFSISIETLLGTISDTLQHQIEADIRRGKPIPEPTPFEQHLHQDENCVSWWTIAHCDVDEQFEDDAAIQRNKDYLAAVEARRELVNRLGQEERDKHLMEALEKVIPGFSEGSAFHANRPVTSDNDQ